MNEGNNTKSEDSDKPDYFKSKKIINIIRLVVLLGEAGVGKTHLINMYKFSNVIIL